MKKQPLKNFIVFNLDGSGSMHTLRPGVIRLFNAQVEFLVKESQRLEQETRAFVYVFSDTVQNLVWDTDVLRLPSIEELYRPEGRTALIDSTLQSIGDIEKIPQVYCDFSVLHYTISDGINNINNQREGILRGRIEKLPENWTMAFMAPDQEAEQQARRFGFNNISRWNVSQKGMEDVGETMRKATSSFMAQRATGVRGTRSGFFKLDVSGLKQTAVKQVLSELTSVQYLTIPVLLDGVGIKDYVESRTRKPYAKGTGFYQLSKREIVQASKEILVRSKKTQKVFGGREARQLIGLPDHEVKVSPDHNTEFEIFVQSTSTTRKLVKGTTLLVLR